MVRMVIHHSEELPNEYILEVWNDENNKKVTIYFNPVVIDVTGVNNATEEVFSLFVQNLSDWSTVWSYLLK